MLELYYFHKFKDNFDLINKKRKLNLQLIPYFISNHPACEVEDMANLAVETKDMGFQLEQVQGFTPTPMTVATVIYYSGYHPYTLKKTFTPKTKREKDEQHRFFFWYKRENQAWIGNTLKRLNRNDLLDKLLPGSYKNSSSRTKKRNNNSGDKKDKFESVLHKFPNKKRPSKNRKR